MVKNIENLQEQTMQVNLHLLQIIQDKLDNKHLQMYIKHTQVEKLVCDFILDPLNVQLKLIEIVSY